MFHLLQAVSPNSIGLDIGVPARGWTGEAYQGHIFWDELFIFPFLNYRMPEITRSLLMYRYRRLGEARAAASGAGYQGAMFPWQSGSDGQEETQELNLNPRSQRWVPDNSYLQRHVGSAIAYNVWQYFQVTHDVEFLQFLRRRADPRYRPLLVEHRELQRRARALRDSRRDGPRRVSRGLSGFADARPQQQCLHQHHGGVGAVPGAGGARPAPRHPSRRARDAAGFVRGRDRALGRHQPQDVSCRFMATASSASSRATNSCASWTGRATAPATATSSASISSSRRRTTAPTATSCRSRPTC